MKPFEQNLFVEETPKTNDAVSSQGLVTVYFLQTAQGISWEGYGTVSFYETLGNSGPVGNNAVQPTNWCKP